MKQKNASLKQTSPIRSMTGFARIAGVTPSNTPFVLSLKSVNHRFLDLQFHLPNGMDALEMQCRKLLKENLVRGHIEVRLAVHRANIDSSPHYNPAALRAYLEAFRAAAAEHGIAGEPDLNVALRLPGAWLTESNGAEDDQAEIAIADILGADGVADAEYDALPRVTFTDPEVGSVGMTQAQATQAGIDVLVGRAALPSTARGWIHGPGNDGLIRLIADADRRVLVGATVVGPSGGEVLSALVVAVHAAVPLDRLRSMIYAYPTFHRGILDAVKDLRRPA